MPTPASPEAPRSRLLLCAAAALAVHASVLGLLWRPAPGPTPSDAVPVELILAGAAQPDTPTATPPAAPPAEPVPSQPPAPEAPPPEALAAEASAPPESAPPQAEAPKPLSPSPPAPPTPAPPRPAPPVRSSAHPQRAARPVPASRQAPSAPDEQRPPYPEAPASPSSNSAQGPAPSAADPVPAADPGALAAWQGRLARQLQRAKRYPDAARNAGEEGVAVVSFTLDRAGAVLSVRLVRSSGSAALDDEAVSLVRRAEPLPAPPSAVTSVPVTLTVPVRFTLQ